MYRYYISFAHEAPNGIGIGIGTLDTTMDRPISTADDLGPITTHLACKGYRQVRILGFSLYASPTRHKAAS